VPEPRNWMRAAAPGIAFRCIAAESSPVGSARHAHCAERRRAPGWLVALSLGLGLWLAGGGLFLFTRAALAQGPLARGSGEAAVDSGQAAADVPVRSSAAARPTPARRIPGPHV